MAIFERGAAASGASRRQRARFRPRTERLEGRVVLAQAIDLVNVASAPFGIQQINQNNFQGAGFSSAIVGDVNGDGFVDMVVGQPTIQEAPGRPVLAGGNGTVYLIFGSQQVDQSGGTVSNVDWRNLNAQQRIGDLAQLGNTSQTNPVNNQAGFNYNGVQFITGQEPNNNFGASVAAAGDVNGDGFADFLIGAPGARDINSNIPGVGRAYLVYGSSSIDQLSNNIIDLSASDPTNGPVRFLIMANSNALDLAASGRSVAAVGNFLSTGFNDIAIGAPLADFAGSVDNGAVFVLAGSFLFPGQGNPPVTGTIDLAQIGTTLPGVILAGPSSDNRVGISVSTAGDFNGDNITDIILGGAGNDAATGAAAVVYGSASLSGLVSLGGIANGTLPGVLFQGVNAGDRTGFAVASAGDFNADGIADIAIGSPGFDGPLGTDSGQVLIIYGPANPVTGVVSLGNIPSSLQFTAMNGPTALANLGHALSPIFSINQDTINELLIGAPGVSSNRGAVFLVPGNRNAVGTFSLAGAGLNNLYVTTMNLPGTTNYLGSSVSGQFFLNTASGGTLDGDGVADMTVGAAGFSFNNATLAGTAYGLEGAFIPLETPPNQPPPAQVTSNIGVNSLDPPGIINLTTDTSVTIFILSTGSSVPGFQPANDIDPNTIRVNNVLLPDPSTFENVGDLDGDGIDDAAFVFSPLTLLNLSPPSATIRVTALTINDLTYAGQLNVQVVRPGGGGGGPSLPITFGPAFQNRNLAAPQWGERFVPPVQLLARARWAGIGPRLAYRQFVAQGAFGYRLRNAFHRDAQMNEPKGRTRTLGREVFTRGRFKPGVHFGRINHKGPVLGDGLAAVGLRAQPNRWR
jgi:hypothetical protein